MWKQKRKTCDAISCGRRGRKLRLTYAQALFYDKSCSIEDMIESHTILKDVDRRWRRVLGPTHPDVQMVEEATSTVGNAIACARRRSRVGT